jgi:Methyltransferase domain
LLGGNNFLAHPGRLSINFCVKGRSMSIVRKVFVKSSRLITVIVERVNGLDFTAHVKLRCFGQDPTVVFKSSPSGGKYLRKVLDDCAITENDAVVDIGCGKGSAMRTLSGYPFFKVGGIELSGRIAAVARRNFRKLHIDKCTVITMNAAEFTDYDRYTFIYFYNPFPPPVMADVLENIYSSLIRTPRRVTLIYDNPLCHDEILKRGVFVRTAEYPDEWGNRIFVYSNRRHEE